MAKREKRNKSRGSAGNNRKMGEDFLEKKFFVPWELAWGKNGTGSKIPPYSMLTFDVRLIDFW